MTDDLPPAAVHAGDRVSRRRPSATPSPGRPAEEIHVPDELRVSDVPGDVASTIGLVTAALQARGVTLFATVDHAGGARAAGLELDDEVLLLFGNPAAGTALMQADPTAGYDLPLRMLVWSQAGTTRVAYQDPAALRRRYALDGEQATLDALRGLLEHLVAEAGGAPR
jgi:uncharacterized protein (DUF302 family)